MMDLWGCSVEGINSWTQGGPHSLDASLHMAGNGPLRSPSPSAAPNHGKMAAAIKDDGLNGHQSVGVDDEIADLMELLSGIWFMKIGITGFKEEPLPAWLKGSD